jgi:murein DD-endopeptidase MepM/ murein hydrolase activator NlpD
MTRPQGCTVCGEPFHDGDRLVVMRGKAHEEFCSEACLRQSERKRRKARAAIRNRLLLGALACALLLAGAGAIWQRFGAPRPQSISFDLPEVRPQPPPSGPIELGPAWPPTDEDWMFAFKQVSWAYPLPGPTRRAAATDGRIFAAEPSKNHRPVCRTEGHCGVDLGGELWGEHVYAVLDGVVDRVQRASTDDGPGAYVRLSHFGGMVFTHYLHLAAIPRGITRGGSVRAGDMIGLLGDTGLEGTPRHLTFALSIRPSGEFSEVFWDPKPLMALWPLRLPVHGTVAGFTPGKEMEVPPHRHPR